eukprot:286686_1
MFELPITDQWVFDWLTSDAHVYVTCTLTILACILHPLLIVVYFYRKLIKPSAPSISNKDDVKDRSEKSSNHGTISRNRSHSNLNQTSHVGGITLQTFRHIITVITLLAVLFGLIASILSLINILTLIGHPNTCQPFTIVQNICWIFTKLCIYNVIIIRLQIAFAGSAYAYNPTLLSIAYCIVNSTCILCIIASIFDVDSIHFETGWCLFIIPTWIILLPCVLDIVCSAFAMYLFIKPLKYILKKQLSNNIGNKQSAHVIKISQLITKLILLSIIAVISNLFGGIFFAVTDIAIFTYLDTVINPICLILMENVNKDIYKLFCKCCHVKLHAIVHYKNDIIKTNAFQCSVDKPSNSDKVSKSKLSDDLSPDSNEIISDNTTNITKTNVLSVSDYPPPDSVDNVVNTVATHPSNTNMSITLTTQ